MIGAFNLKDVRTEHIQRFYNHLGNQNIGIPTICKLHKLLRSAFENAIETHMISNNPVVHTHPPKEAEPEIHIWNENQVSTFFTAINDLK